MKLSRIFTPIFVLFTSVHSQQNVSYDQTYDDGSHSLATVTCSDGPNGLMTKGYNTFQDVPFPYLGGGPGVSFNSPDCGTCVNLTYDGNSVTVELVDEADFSYNIGLKAMNVLTGNQAKFLGRVLATAAPVPC